MQKSKQVVKLWVLQLIQIPVNWLYDLGKTT